MSSKWLDGYEDLVVKRVLQIIGVLFAVAVIVSTIMVIAK